MSKKISGRVGRARAEVTRDPWNSEAWKILFLEAQVRVSLFGGRPFHCVVSSHKPSLGVSSVSPLSRPGQPMRRCCLYFPSRLTTG